MENRKVRFERAQDALLWLMSNRNANENKAKLYDEYGNYVIHSPYNNIIEYYYEIDPENGDWDFDRLSYEDFINKFEGIILESI